MQPKKCIAHLLYISVNGHLDGFHTLAMINNAAGNMGVQIPLRDPAFNTILFYTYENRRIIFTHSTLSSQNQDRNAQGLMLKRNLNESRVRVTPALKGACSGPSYAPDSFSPWMNLPQKAPW